jgi:PAS domain S-box-containing protein
MSPELSDTRALLAAEHAVSRSLAETVAHNDVYPNVLAAIGNTLGWAFGAAWEIRGDVLFCVETWCREDRDPAFAQRSRLSVFNRGEGLPGRVWQTEMPAWIVDLAADENFPRAALAAADGLESAFCFPVMNANGVAGAIEFYTDESTTPDARLMQTMRSLGAQIGQFVQRRRAEEEVHKVEQRTRAILDAALDAIITIDHAGVVIDFNPAAERAFGYDADAAIGREMADLIVPPHLREPHRRGMARLVGGGEPQLLGRRVETMAMRADGKEFPVELTITRIDVPGPPMFTGHVRDITERRKSEVALRESRARIVAAADAERRRLERDLHDGAQQRLVGLGLSLRLGRTKLETDPRETAALLDEAIEDLTFATAELRELARGIHPAVLTEGGLEPALGALSSRAAVPVDLDVGVGRLPANVEATAYFVVAEALTNVARYAEAESAEVSVHRDGDTLRVRVVDNGRGGADLDAGSGLCGLADRCAAIDGTFTVTSPVGEGTTIEAELPCA